MLRHNDMLRASYMVGKAADTITRRVPLPREFVKPDDDQLCAPDADVTFWYVEFLPEASQRTSEAAIRTVSPAQAQQPPGRIIVNGAFYLNCED